MCIWSAAGFDKVWNFKNSPKFDHCLLGTTYYMKTKHTSKESQDIWSIFEPFFDFSKSDSCWKFNFKLSQVYGLYDHPCRSPTMLLCLDFFAAKTILDTYKYAIKTITAHLFKYSCSAATHLSCRPVRMPPPPPCSSPLWRRALRWRRLRRRTSCRRRRRRRRQTPPDRTLQPESRTRRSLSESWHGRQNDGDKNFQSVTHGKSKASPGLHAGEVRGPGILAEKKSQRLMQSVATNQSLVVFALFC